MAARSAERKREVRERTGLYHRETGTEGFFLKDLLLKKKTSKE